jgi:hypothetical protein
VRVLALLARSVPRLQDVHAHDEMDDITTEHQVRLIGFEWLLADMRESILQALVAAEQNSSEEHRRVCTCDSSLLRSCEIFSRHRPSSRAFLLARTSTKPWCPGCCRDWRLLQRSGAASCTPSHSNIMNICLFCVAHPIQSSIWPCTCCSTRTRHYLPSSRSSTLSFALLCF